jgi:hypothetical protein
MLGAAFLAKDNQSISLLITGWQGYVRFVGGLSGIACHCWMPEGLMHLPLVD